MGRWNYDNYGINVKKEEQELAKQLFECAGVSFEAVRSSEDAFEFESNIELLGSSSHAEISFEELFFIARGVFENVILFSESETGNSVTDACDRYECLWDANTMTEHWRTIEYDMGGDMVLDGINIHDAVPWNSLKTDIESELINENKYRKSIGQDVIESNWIERDGHMEPDEGNEDFCDFCYDYFSNNVSFRDVGSRSGDRPIELVEISRESLNSLIDNAEEKGYAELVNRLKSIDDRKRSHSLQNSCKKREGEPVEKQVDLTGAVVVTTGLTADEESWVQATVEGGGGTYKPKFVKSLTMLVYNPNYDHETTKLRDAKALIAAGEQIKIITLEEFRKL